MKCEAAQHLSSISKLMCQFAHPFMRDRKNPDSSGNRTHEPWDVCQIGLSGKIKMRIVLLFSDLE